MPCYSHLSRDERTEIGILIGAGYSIGAIARALGRAKSTISRELKRNRLPRGGYSPCHGDGAYMARRQRASVLECDAVLECFVIQRLSEGWSPEQIAGWLKTGVEKGLRAVCTETIYAFMGCQAGWRRQAW